MLERVRCSLEGSLLRHVVYKVFPIGVDYSVGAINKKLKIKDVYSKANALFLPDENSNHLPVQSIDMFRLTKRLKRVKESMEQLNKVGFYSIQADVNRAYQRLFKVQ
ncbi:DNA polymerase IV [Bienertia sinuspersici]